MINYFYNELGESVLVITPGNKAKDEIIKRYKLRFGFEIPTGIDEPLSCVITSGFMNKKSMKDPELIKQEEEKLKKYFNVILDEGEYVCSNEAGMWILNHLVNTQRWMNFSGTADKKNAKMISFAKGITDTVMDNKNLVSVFGPSLVYRTPTNIIINNVTIYTSVLDKVRFTEEDFAEDKNVYNTVLTKIWTDNNVCRLIVKIAKRFPMLFIPINNLQNIIQHWIDDFFIPAKLRVLLICYEGYLYYDSNGNMTNLTLEESCEKVANKEVDIIPSTSSGYRALDFKGLENILLIQGIVAGVTLQCIGRCLRGTKANIISLDTKSHRKIPVYSKGLEHRREMIAEYYKYCEMNDILLDENNL